MTIVHRQLLEAFSRRHPDARGAVAAWEAEVRDANWQRPHDVQQRYPKASVLKSSRCVFNLCGNRYRLIVKFNYPVGVAQVRWCGTHQEYDHIDAESV
jgi:mRNA interferase HigB